MNNDTDETARECAREAGALLKCSKCGEPDVCAYDEEAERRTYVIAEQKRKSGERGFRGMTSREVKDIIKDLLAEAGSCSRCPQW